MRFGVLFLFCKKEMRVKKIRFPDTTAIGIKPVSSQGSKRLVRRALRYAIDNDCESLTLVHKGNIMKYTEGAFMRWGYQLVKEEYEGRLLDGGPWARLKTPSPIVILSLRIASPIIFCNKF